MHFVREVHWSQSWQIASNSLMIVIYVIYCNYWITIVMCCDRQVERRWLGRWNEPRWAICHHHQWRPAAFEQSHLQEDPSPDRNPRLRQWMSLRHITGSSRIAPWNPCPTKYWQRKTLAFHLRAKSLLHRASLWNIPGLRALHAWVASDAPGTTIQPDIPKSYSSNFAKVI